MNLVLRIKIGRTTILTSIAMIHVFMQYMYYIYNTIYTGWVLNSLLLLFGIHKQAPLKIPLMFSIYGKVNLPHDESYSRINHRGLKHLEHRYYHYMGKKAWFIETKANPNVSQIQWN